jgi:hypothetical protein
VKPTEQKSDQSKPVDKSGESNSDKNQSDKGESSSGEQQRNQSSPLNQNKPENVASGEKNSRQGEGEKEGSEKPETEKSEGEKSNSEKPEGEKKEGVKLPTDRMPNPMAEQAAKALSNQLLKKAEQLRAGQLNAEDIKKLQQAAENLARDLAPLAQSKEFQQSLAELAKRVDPEQLEQVARELMKNEQLKKELEATARMLAENRQVKEFVAGLKQKFGNDQPGESRQQARNQGQGDGTGKGTGDKKLEMGAPKEELKGQGKEKQLAAKMQKRPGGEYLFLQARPGAGAVRAPYSSAYPQYRREAERAVERSRVPAHLRSMVKNYFDVINPDAEKKP